MSLISPRPRTLLLRFDRRQNHLAKPYRTVLKILWYQNVRTQLQVKLRVSLRLAKTLSNPFPQRRSRTRLPAPTIEPFESAFTANDFEPQLLGAPRESTKIKSLTQPPNALAESTPRQPEELASTTTNNNSSPINLTFNIEEPPEIDTRRRIPFKLNTARTEELREVRARSQSYDDFQEHVVRNNESLQSISTDYFGKPDFYLDIYLANRENLMSPVGIKPGTKLKIPTIK